MNRRQFLQRGLLVTGTASAAAVSELERPAATAGPSQRPRPQRTLIIDAHCHAGKGMNYGKNDPAAPPWTTFNDPEWTLRKNQQAGIDLSVIFPISNQTYEAANREIAEYVSRYRGKFIGFAKHDARTEAGRIKGLLRREVRELGLKGLKLHGVPSKEMLEAAAELDIPILFHPPRVADALPAVRAWPQIHFILAHLGSFASRNWTEHLRAIDAARQLPNLYLETSSVVFFDYLKRAAAELPAEKLIFGSDGPLVDARVELYKVRLLKLPAEKQRLVLGGNMSRLLGLADQRPEES